MFHVTLAFLGDVPDLDLNPVCLAVAEACKNVPRFTVNLKSLGAFPDPDRPRVVWVGLTGPGLDAMNELRKSIADSLAQAGFPPEDNRFTPHLTLGYIKSKKGQEIDVNALIAHYQMWSAGNFAVTGITTFSSTTTPEGPAYMPMASVSLR